MRIDEWPNRLGWDVGDHEVWKLAGGDWGVRVFEDGEPRRSLRWQPRQTSLFEGESIIDAVQACLRVGEEIE